MRSTEHQLLKPNRCFTQPSRSFLKDPCFDSRLKLIQISRLVADSYAVEILGANLDKDSVL